MAELNIGNVTYPADFPCESNLVFNADFESGNLGRVDAISLNEYDLFIRPDTCNNKYRVWFYFECCNAVENQVGSAAPVVRNSCQTSWSRVPSKHIYYYRSALHGHRPILSFAFIFDSNQPVEFAYSIPYSYSKLQRWLDSIEKRKLEHFQRDVLCLSVQRRRVDVLTICSDVFCQAKRRVVVVSARVHPGETPSSFVMHGFVEFLISSDPRAIQLRSEYCFKIIPMLNPDGVFLGNYRCSVLGCDLNRQWRRPIDWSHPSIYAIKKLITQYNNNPQTPVSLYLDLHAHSQKTNCFLYGNVSSIESERDRQLWLPHLLAQLADDYSLEYTQFNTNEDKEGTARRHCFTLEVSFFSYQPVGSLPSNAVVPYLQFKYESLGESLAVSLLHLRQAEAGQREVTISREYQTFVVKKTQNTIKEVETAMKQAK